LAPLLVDLELPDFDLGSMLGSSRVLTQAIARWAYDHGAAGLVYHSRLDCRLTCWALFEGAAFSPLVTLIRSSPAIATSSPSPGSLG
jgi:hypothetical protein